jgi:hypothetical protein
MVASRGFAKKLKSKSRGVIFATKVPAEMPANTSFNLLKPVKGTLAAGAERPLLCSLERNAATGCGLHSGRRRWKN